MCEQVSTRLDLQKAYIELYRHMCEYIWPYATVLALGEIEMECAKPFPRKEKLLELLYSLQKTSEDLKNTQTFQDLVDAAKSFDENTSKVNVSFDYLENDEGDMSLVTFGGTK